MNIPKMLFYDIPFSTWNNGFFGKLITICFLSFFTKIILFLLYFLFIFVNSAGLNHQVGLATVVSHRESTNNNPSLEGLFTSNNSLVSSQKSNPTKFYYVKFKVNDIDGEAQVDEKIYKSFEIGSNVHIKYAKHRLTNSLSFIN